MERRGGGGEGWCNQNMGLSVVLRRFYTSSNLCCNVQQNVSNGANKQLQENSQYVSPFILLIFFIIIGSILSIHNLSTGYNTNLHYQSNNIALSIQNWIASGDFSHPD